MRTLAGTAAGVAMAALVAIGCSQPADEQADATIEFAPTASFLRQAADGSSEVPYRSTVAVDVTDTSGWGERMVNATGAFDGERFQIRADMSHLPGADDLPEGVTRDDLFIETVTDDDTLWARAPLFRATLGDEGVPEAAPDGVAELIDALAEDWITVDVAELADVDPAWAACMLAGQRADPTAYLDLVRATEDIEELGSDEIDGVAVQGLGGDVTLRDMLRQARGDDSPSADDGTSPLDDVTIPVEVWLDAAGHVRRITITEDTSETLDALVEAEVLPPAAAEGEKVVITQTVDLSDHGDPDIEVEVPTDPADMTDAYRSFLLATDAMPPPEGTDLEDDLASLEDMYGDVESMPGYPGAPPSPGSPEDLEAAYDELDAMYDELEAMPDHPLPPPMPDYEVPPLPEPPPAYEIPPMPEMPEIPDYEIPPMPEMPEPPPDYEIPPMPEMPEG